MLLALDTAADLCAACLWADGHEVARAVEAMRTGHAERLMAVIETALGAAGARYGDVSGIIVSIGPGSFTGIRVGVATARGLALALGVPAVGVSTLEALAAQARAEVPGQPAMVALEGGRGAIHAAAFTSAGKVLREPASLDLGEARAWTAELSPVLAGNAAQRVAEGSAHPVVHPEATADIATFARLGAIRLAEGATEKPRPLYIRPPDAKPQAGGILRQSA